MSEILVIPGAPRLKHGVKAFDLSTLPRCGARTRQGKLCNRYGNRINGRCRLHGGRSTGAKSNRQGVNNPNFKTGYHTRKAKQQRKELAALIHRCKQFYNQG